GHVADLTGRAEWSSTAERTTFCYRGLVEGLAEGEGGVRARYRPGPDAPYQEATASFRVAAADFKALELAVEPSPVVVGTPSALKAEALTAGGEKRPVLGSSLLTWETDPATLAVIDGTHLLASRAGKGRVTATFRGLSATLHVEA